MSTTTSTPAARGVRAVLSIVLLLAGALVGLSGPAGARAAAPSDPLLPILPPPQVQGVSASPGDGSATVTWTPSPLVSLISSYTVATTDGSASVTVQQPNADTAVVGGLENGRSYRFVVTAQNVLGTSPVSVASNEVTPVAAAVLPGRVSGVSATAGVSSAQVSWTPLSSGDVQGYVVTSSPEGRSVTVPGTRNDALVLGLTNGTAYTFTVQAVNAVGAGAASAPSAPVTPTLLPGPDPDPTDPGDPGGPQPDPTDPGEEPGPVDPLVPRVSGPVTAVAGDGQAQVSWTAATPPLVRGYVVVATPGGHRATVDGATTTTAVVGGLENGTSYTFTVQSRAVVGDGVSEPSAASAAVVPAGVPSAPTTLRVQRGDRELAVRWGPAADNGSPVDGYEVSVGGRTVELLAGARSLVVGDLVNGRSYDVAVSATNEVGTGEAATQRSVTPVGAPGRVARPKAKVTGRKVVLTWRTPAANGDSVDGYRVLVNGRPRQTTRPRLVLRKARPGRYVVRVIARNGAGAARPSTPVRFRVRR